MVLTQAKTDSMQSNSARPKDCAFSGLGADRFQLIRGPQAFNSLSKRELDAYFGILLMNTDFLSSFYISTGILVELSNSSATLFCYFTIMEGCW